MKYPRSLAASITGILAVVLVVMAWPQTRVVEVTEYMRATGSSFVKTSVTETRLAQGLFPSRSGTEEISEREFRHHVAAGVSVRRTHHCGTFRDDFTVKTFDPASLRAGRR